MTWFKKRRPSVRTDEMLALLDQNLALAYELKETYEPTPPPDGTIVKVSDAAGLTEALATVTGPAEIRVAPGEYRGNFVLRNREDTAVVTIRADLENAALEPLGAGGWVTPAQAGAFPKLGVADPGAPILTTQNGAHDWTLRGLEFLGNPARPDYTLVEFGRGDEATVDDVPSRLVLDACYVHGDPAKGCRRGVSLQSQASTIKHCYISDCWYQGNDAQAIAVWNSPGDLLIAQNYLEGSGENLILGGSDPKIPGLVTTTVTITGNYIHKPQAWRQLPGSVKNLLELKNARGVLIENNVLEGCWVDGQPGHAVVFTVRNQDGGAPQATVAEVVFQWNVVKDTEGCFVNLLGIDDLHPSVRGDGMTIAQNLFLDGAGGVQSLSGFLGTHVSHNAFTGPDWKWLQFGGQPLPSGEFRWLDNAVPPTEYGITGDNTGIGTPSLDHYAPGHDVRCNSIGMKGWVVYPDGNYLLYDNPPADYLAQVASDGGTVGPDLAELQRRIPWYPVPSVLRRQPRPESSKSPIPFGMR